MDYHFGFVLRRAIIKELCNCHNSVSGANKPVQGREPLASNVTMDIFFAIESQNSE
jgi:hypothetical protein